MIAGDHEGHRRRTQRGHVADHEQTILTDVHLLSNCMSLHLPIVLIKILIQTWLVVLKARRGPATSHMLAILPADSSYSTTMPPLMPAVITIMIANIMNHDTWTVCSNTSHHPCKWLGCPGAACAKLYLTSFLFNSSIQSFVCLQR